MTTMTIESKGASPIGIGCKVILRGCRCGQPGTVLRIERHRLVVYWSDLDFLSRHHPDSLVLAEDAPRPARNLDSPLQPG